MKLFLSIVALFFITACNNPNRNTRKENAPLWFDSIPFGTVQPLLEKNSPGEKLLRIDSIGTMDSSYTVFYVTDKGVREYSGAGKFKTLVVKGYKADGTHSCVGAHSFGEMWVSTCGDSACTIVIDSVLLDRKVRPYAVLHPEKDKADSCPPLINKQH